MNILRKTILSLFIFPTLFEGIVSSWDHFLSPFLHPSLFKGNICPHSRAFFTKIPFLISFSTSTLLQMDYCPIQGSFCNRSFLTSRDCCPIQGSICNRPFLTSFFTSTLVQRDCCLIQGSFCNRPFLASFSTSTLSQRDCCPHSRIVLQWAIPSLFFYLYPCSKGLSPHSMVFLQ